MRTSRQTVLFLTLALALAGCRNQEARTDTDWMYEAKVGAFMHFLPNEENFNLVDSFDVRTLADQLEEAGVGYFVLTLGQNSGFFNAPNPVYDKISGYPAGARTSLRDLPLELGQELQSRNIPLMLYLPCQTPNRDLQAVVSFGFPDQEENNDRHLDDSGVQNWAKVIEWWSVHYGNLVKGWWFDGGYDWCGFNDEIGAMYYKAAKAGNPESVIAFNPGVKPECCRNVRTEDYTAGEANDFLPMKSEGRFTDGLQTHILSFLGSSWGGRNCRFQSQEIVPWIREYTASGGVVTFDVGPNYDPQAGPVGSISKEQAEQLRQLSMAVH